MVITSKFNFYAVKLSAVIIVFFILQLLVKGFTELFVLNRETLFGFQIWRLATAIFLHGGLAHLVLNLFALLLFGSILEKIIGGRNFLIVFFVTGILANLIAANFYDSSLGASGAIFGVIGCIILIRPNLPVWAFGLPMPIFVAGIIWGVADVLGAVGFLVGNPINNTGNIAHLSGMFFGFVFGIYFRRFFAIAKNKNKIFINEEAIRNWENRYMN